MIISFQLKVNWIALGESAGCHFFIGTEPKVHIENPNAMVVKEVTIISIVEQAAVNDDHLNALIKGMTAMGCSCIPQQK